MEAISTALLEYGAMGIFAAFLVWQHLSMQKRSDAMIEKFNEQIDRMRESHKQELKELRDQYTEMMNKQTENQAKTQTMFFDKISEVDRDTDQIIDILKEMQNEKKLKELAKQMVAEENS
jgi:arylsulfatase A-like enzyme